MGFSFFLPRSLSRISNIVPAKTCQCDQLREIIRCEEQQISKKRNKKTIAAVNSAL